MNIFLHNINYDKFNIKLGNTLIDPHFRIDKDEYLQSMKRNVVKDIEIKHLFKHSLTEKINDRAIFM